MDAINEKGLVAAAVLLWAIRGDENPGHSCRKIRSSSSRNTWSPGMVPTTWCGFRAERLLRRQWREMETHRQGGFRRGQARAGGTSSGRHAVAVGCFQGREVAGCSELPSGHGDDSSTLAWIHSGPPAKKWRDEPAKPLINLEPPYEDHLAYQSRKPHSDYSVRRAPPWRESQRPHGRPDLWGARNLELAKETSAGEPLAHKGTGQAKLWRDMNLPGSAQMGHIVKILGALPWWALKPAQDMLMRQPARTHRDRCRSADRGRSPLRALSPRWRRDRSQSRHLREQLPRVLGRSTDGPAGSRTLPANAFKAPNEQDWLLIIGRW